MPSIILDRMDGLSSSTAIKGPVRVVATTPIALSGLQTIDGIAVVAGDRVLVNAQVGGIANGIYVVDSGTWRRPADFSNNRDVRLGTQVFVTSGATNANSSWFVSTEGQIDIGTLPIAFTMSEEGAANLAALTAAAEAAAAEADQARDETLDALATVSNITFASLAAASLYNPTVAPTYITLAGNFAPGDGGNAVYNKVVSEPAHSGKFQIAQGSWYEIQWSSVPPALGECVLELNGTGIKLNPMQAGRVPVDRLVRIVPAAGISLAATGLTVGTLYYVYLYDNAGTLTLMASTTTHEKNTTTGVEQMLSDATKTFVGWVVPDTGPIFRNTSTKQWVRSWFNDSGIHGFNALPANSDRSLNSWGELNSGGRIEFISRGEFCSVYCNGANFHAAVTGKLSGTSVGIDGATPQDGPTINCSPKVDAGVNYMPIGGTWDTFIAEGKHYATLVGRSYDAATFTWLGDTITTNARCVLGISSGKSTGGLGSAYKEVMGVIGANLDGTWTLYDDIDHTPINVTSVTQDANAITIHYAVTGSKVRGGYATMDEAISVNSQCDKLGPSIGLSIMVIYLGKIDGNGNSTRVNPNTVTTGDIWFYVRMS